MFTDKQIKRKVNDVADKKKKSPIAHQLALPRIPEGMSDLTQLFHRDISKFPIVYTHWRDGRITRHIEQRGIEPELINVGRQPVYKVNHETYEQRERWLSFIAMHEYNLTLGEARAMRLLPPRLMTLSERKAQRRKYWQKKKRFWEKKSFIEEYGLQEQSS